LAGILLVADQFWTKEVLRLSAVDLQLAAFWKMVPWTIKMLFAQFVDVRPILGSPRRSYIYVGAACMGVGFLMLAGLAGGWPVVMALGTPVSVYFLGTIAVSLGLVIQDVTADAMTSEVIKDDERESRNIQLLGRLAIGAGGLIAAFYAASVAIFAAKFPGGYSTIFTYAVIIPVISVLGAMLWRHVPVALEKWNKTIVWSGAAFAVFVIALQFTPVPWKAEITYAVNVVVVLVCVSALALKIKWNDRISLICMCTVAFVFKAMPKAGPGVGWWQIDVLKFDRSFLGELQWIGHLTAFFLLLFFAKQLKNHAVARVLVIVTIVETILGLPQIGMYYGLHEWTQAHLGFGARAIAWWDTALDSPFHVFALLPVIAFVAMIGKKSGNAATWFALAASLFNLAGTTSEITTKWLTQIYPVVQASAHGPGDYHNLGTLMILTRSLALVVPLLAIWLFRKRLDYES